MLLLLTHKSLLEFLRIWGESGIIVICSICHLTKELRNTLLIKNISQKNQVISGFIQNTDLYVILLSPKVMVIELQLFFLTLCVCEEGRGGEAVSAFRCKDVMIFCG